jgi:hypothetical protein
MAKNVSPNIIRKGAKTNSTPAIPGPAGSKPVRPLVQRRTKGGGKSK